jgi:hypothetical protein
MTSLETTKEFHKIEHQNFDRNPKRNPLQQKEGKIAEKTIVDKQEEYFSKYDDGRKQSSSERYKQRD